MAVSWYNTAMPPLILASTSQRRRLLLPLLGLPYTVVAPDVDETVLPDETPTAMVLRLARLKVQTVARLHPEAVVLACDTTVALGDEVVGKPVDAADAVAILRRLRGGPHMVYSGVAVARDGQMWDEVVETDIVMRPYTDAEIDTYVATGDPLDKAGAYAVQHPTFTPVARLAGCYANVVGLPLCAVRRLLIQAGVAAPPSSIDACAPPTVCVVPSVSSPGAPAPDH